jgi:hypothetical protein
MKNDRNRLDGEASEENGIVKRFSSLNWVKPITPKNKPRALDAYYLSKL